jgi:hypothetical protein
MTLANLLTRIKKFYPSTYELNQAVSAHRQQNDTWNWVDAASDLLEILEANND